MFGVKFDTRKQHMVVDVFFYGMLRNGCVGESREKLGKYNCSLVRVSGIIEESYDTNVTVNGAERE